MHHVSSDPYSLQPLASHMYKLTAQCSVSSQLAADITSVPHDSLVLLRLTASALHPRG